MSLATWKAKYYPIPANKVRGPLAAIKHSLRKWRGLRDLAAHHLTRTRWGAIAVDRDRDQEIYPERFEIDYNSCALCHLYVLKDESCHRCPLAQLRAGTRCDAWHGGERQAPYGAWTTGGDPKPMIRLLERALAAEQAKAKRSQASKPTKKQSHRPAAASDNDS